jgi:hypothetical protein
MAQKGILLQVFLLISRRAGAAAQVHSAARARGFRLFWQGSTGRRRRWNNIMPAPTRVVAARRLATQRLWAYARAGAAALRFQHQTFCQLQPRRGACAVITGSTAGARGGPNEPLGNFYGGIKHDTALLWEPGRVKHARDQSVRSPSRRHNNRPG